MLVSLLKILLVFNHIDEPFSLKLLTSHMGNSATEEVGASEALFLCNLRDLRARREFKVYKHVTNVYGWLSEQTQARVGRNEFRIQDTTMPKIFECKAYHEMPILRQRYFDAVFMMCWSCSGIVVVLFWRCLRDVLVFFGDGLTMCWRCSGES